MGSHRQPHRDLQDERRRTLRLAQGHRKSPPATPTAASTNSSPGTSSRRQAESQVPLTHRVWTPLVTQAFSSVGSVHAVRRCRVSGLSMRQVTRRGPSWRCADRVQIAYASSMAPQYELVFPIPSRLTVCPCLSSDLSPTAARRPVRRRREPGNSPSSSSAPR